MRTSRILGLLRVAALLSLAGAPLAAGAATGEPAALSRLRLLPPGPGSSLLLVRASAELPGGATAPPAGAELLPGGGTGSSDSAELPGGPPAPFAGAALPAGTTAVSDAGLADAPLSPARIAVELSLAYPTHLAATAGALLLATRVVTDATGPGLDGRLAAIEGGDLPGQAAFAISLVLVAPLCSAAVVWAIADGTPGFDAQLLLTYAGGATAQALALGLVALFPGAGAILLGPLLVAVTEVAVANLTRLRSPAVAALPPAPAPATGASPGPPGAAARVASSATLLHASF